jgi:hypothetical protein
MGSSFLRLGLAALGFALVACGFDWDGAYGARFGGNAQTGAGAGVPVGEFGGSFGASDTGGAPDTGGAANTGGSSDTGGAADTGGTGGSAAGAGGCSGNLVENPGFELADEKGVPTGWDRLSPESSTDGSFTAVATAAYEGANSLLVDTTSLKKPPADYVLVVATSQAYDVTAIPTLYLSAVAWANDPLAPIWVAILYFDSGGGLLGSVLTVDHLAFTPSTGFVAAGPLASSVPPLAATARVGIVAGQGVAAYVDSVCLTR